MKRYLMRLQSIWILILAVCAFFGVSAETGAKRCEADTASFVLVKEDNGISLYERWYAVRPNLYAREIKATFTVNAESEAALALIKDESKGRDWNRNTEEYRVLTGADDVWFSYIQYDLPWPVSNQDCVLKYNRYYSGNGMQIFFHNTHHPEFPIQKRIQRIPEISGKWIFRETSEGMTVEYYITTTPSDTLPTWLTDPIIRNNLIQNLLDFKNILEKNS